MTTTRKTRATSEPPQVPETTPAPLIKASAEGAMAVCAIFARGGNTLWLAGRVIEVGRDEFTGDMWLRTRNDTERTTTEHELASYELATLSGMLMAAAVIQQNNGECS